MEFIPIVPWPVGVALWLLRTVYRAAIRLGWLTVVILLLLVWLLTWEM